MDGPSQVTGSQTIPATMLCCSGTWSHTAKCSRAQPAWHKQWEKTQSRNRAEREGVPRICSLFMVQNHIVWPLTWYRLWSLRNSKNLIAQQRHFFAATKADVVSDDTDKLLAFRQSGVSLLSKAACFHLRVQLICQSIAQVALCICKTLPQVAYLTPNSRWFTVHAANTVILGFQVSHGLVIQQAAAFIVEMFQMFCLWYLGALSLILPPLLLLQCLYLEVSIRTRYSQPTNFPEFQSIGIPNHSHAGGQTRKLLYLLSSRETTTSTPFLQDSTVYPPQFFSCQGV